MNEIPVVMVPYSCDTPGLVSTELTLGLTVLTLGLVITCDDLWNLVRSAALL